MCESSSDNNYLSSDDYYVSDYGFVNFLHTFGPRAIFEFDRENNQFFSKNNYENAKNIIDDTNINNIEIIKYELT